MISLLMASAFIAAQGHRYQFDLSSKSDIRLSAKQVVALKTLLGTTSSNTPDAEVYLHRFGHGSIVVTTGYPKDGKAHPAFEFMPIEITRNGRVGGAMLRPLHGRD